MTSSPAILRLEAPAGVFTLGAWPGEAAFVGAMSRLALLIALKLARVPPPAHLRAP
jgi:hypothetical protein